MLLCLTFSKVPIDHGQVSQVWSSLAHIDPSCTTIRIRIQFHRPRACVEFDTHFPLLCQWCTRVWYKGAGTPGTKIQWIPYALTTHHVGADLGVVSKDKLTLLVLIKILSRPL